MTASFQLFEWGAAYLAVHFLLYVLIFRHMRLFSSERVIFLYHLISALVVGGALFGMSAVHPGPRWTASILGLISLHGIYSLSFLELWTLSEGSYSLSILRHIAAKGAGGMQTDLGELYKIGTGKKERRIESLQRLRLVRRRGDRLDLTLLGRLAALGLCSIVRMVNPKNRD